MTECIFTVFDENKSVFFNNLYLQNQYHYKKQDTGVT